MQTFLPYPEFEKCAAAIDKKRAWKQVVECKQILCALHYEKAPGDWKETRSWISRPYLNHPAVKMWKGYEELLARYYNVFLEHCKDQLGIRTGMPELKENFTGPDPFWLGNPDFHRAYRARLIEKAPDYYEPLFPGDKGFNNGQYLWPDMETKTFYTI